MSIRTFAALCLTFVFGAAWADEPRAVLTQASGTPIVYELGSGEVRQAAFVQAGQSYSLPIEVETGASDSATFELPNSVIEVSASSMMRIVAPDSVASGVVQRVLQRAGSVLFHVRRGTIERFQVETPFLVSVVKGTVFNVLVRDDGATVSLQEGRLQVDSVDASQSVELLPGDVAFAGLDGVLRVLDVQLTNTDANARVPARASTDAAPEAAHDVAALAGAEASTTERADASLPPAADTVVKNVEEPTIGTVTPVVRDVPAPLASVADPVVSPKVDIVVSPILDHVVAPVVDDVVPVVDSVTKPVVDTVVSPVVDNVVTPVVEPVVVPVVDALVDPILTTDPLVQDVVPSVVDATAPLIDPLVPALDPVLPDSIDPLTPTGPVGRVLGGLL
jgi:FecR protein